MPLLVTDGTTSRQQRTGVVWAEGKVTSDTGYVDMRFGAVGMLIWDSVEWIC